MRNFVCVLTIKLSFSSIYSYDNHPLCFLRYTRDDTPLYPVKKAKSNDQNVEFKNSSVLIAVKTKKKKTPSRKCSKLQSILLLVRNLPKKNSLRDGLL